MVLNQGSQIICISIDIDPNKIILKLQDIIIKEADVNASKPPTEGVF